MNLICTDGEIRDSGSYPQWDILFNGPAKDYPHQREEQIMKLKLIVQDPVSGVGHYLFLPRGAIIFNLLKQYMYSVYSEMGCFFLESPILTDHEHAAVRNHAQQSGEETYHTTSSGKHLSTKIGALYSQLELISQKGLDPEAMPLKLFEMAKCCRIEDNAFPMRRSCEFTMVDMHELCVDLDQALAESQGIHQRIIDLGKEFDWQYHCTYTVTQDFLKNHLDWMVKLTQMQAKEALLIPADPGKGRPINVEYHIDTGCNDPVEVAAFQLDYQNPVKFNIRQGNGAHPVLIHANIVGSIERFMYVLITQAIENKKFPVWLAPEQIRFVPQSATDMDGCMAYAEKGRQQNMRVTVDDRLHLTVSQRSVCADEDMVPYTCLMQGGRSTWVNGNDSTNANGIEIAKLYHRIGNETAGKPSLSATYPLKLSQWTDFF